MGTTDRSHATGGGCYLLTFHRCDSVLDFLGEGQEAKLFVIKLHVSIYPRHAGGSVLVSTFSRPKSTCRRVVRRFSAGECMNMSASSMHFTSPCPRTVYHTNADGSLEGGSFFLEEKMMLGE